MKKKEIEVEQIRTSQVVRIFVAASYEKDWDENGDETKPLFRGVYLSRTKMRKDPYADKGCVEWLANKEADTSPMFMCKPESEAIFPSSFFVKGKQFEFDVTLAPVMPQKKKRKKKASKISKTSKTSKAAKKKTRRR